MKKYLIIIPVLLFVYLLTLNKDENIFDSKELLVDNELKEEKKSENVSHMVSIYYNNIDTSLDIEDYIIGVLACEMPASFNVEALKAGAVAARTFYLYKKNYEESYVAKNSDQCFIDESAMREKWNSEFDKYYNIIKEAVMTTKNEYIAYNDEPIQAFYFSMSNGYTEDVANVFSEEKPYLVSIPSLWDKNIKSYEKVVSFSKSDFLSKLGLPDSDEVNLNVISRNSSNRVNLISVNGKKFSGPNFRKLLSLRSTDYDIDVEDSIVNITTRGYGHGVGLSQYGANEMAKLGYNYKDILKYYYSGVEILTLDV